MEYFKVFECIGYVHHADQKRKKLDDKICTFGVEHGIKGMQNVQLDHQKDYHKKRYVL